jgi:hypothetical protein
MKEDTVKSNHSDNESDSREEIEESPPILKSWSRLYTVVMVNLVFWLLTFYILRRIFE